MNRIFLTLLFMVLPLGLSASSNDDLSKSKGTDQTDVSRHAKIEAVFAVPLEASLVKKHDVKLTLLSTKNHDGKPTFLFTKKHKHIEGTISYDDAEHKVTFTPIDQLEPGMYEVEIKSLKADKAHKNTKIKEIKYRFLVVKELLQSITIIPDVIDVKEGTVVQLQAFGHYDIGIERNITSWVSWNTSDTVIANVDSTATMHALKEGVTTLKALLNNIEGNVSVTVYKEINGYRLPLEPDPTINNSTLLGIDSNGNGVRDDVERLIVISEAKNIEYPVTQTAIKLQFAKAWQKIIETPIVETRIHLEKASACRWYWYDKKVAKIESFSDSLTWIQAHSGVLGVELEDQIFNTKNRIQQRFKFNTACSGRIFQEYPRSIDACDEKIDAFGE